MNKPNKRSKHKEDGIKPEGYGYIFLFVAFLIADRLTKLWAMNLKENIDYGLLAFKYIVNTGAGFSIFQNMNTLLIWLSLIILGLIIVFYDRFPKVSLLLIVSGLIGNLIDRIFLGHVIDFIDFKFWPVFNIADSLIVIGAILMIIIVMKEDVFLSKKKKQISKIRKTKTSSKKQKSTTKTKSRKNK